MIYLIQTTPSSGSRVVPCERTDTRTDMKKLIAVLKNAPKNAEIFHFTASDTQFKGLEYQHKNCRMSKKKSYQSE